MQRQNFFSLIRVSCVFSLCLLAIMLGGLPKPEAAVQPASFGTTTDFATGIFPASVAMEDFNGDGKLGTAVPDWGWSFAPLGTLSPTDHVYGRATIFNRATSTVPLDLANAGFIEIERFHNGIHDCCNYLFGFGRDEPFPWTQFLDQIRAVVLAPGQSHSFDFVTETPQFAVGASPGSYSDGLTISPINGASITNQLTWNVASGCQLPVTRLTQFDPQWASNLYDHSTVYTIRQKGCALTSLAMALNFAGMSTNPGSLTQFMASTNGDYNGLSVNWDAATRDASGSALLKFFPARRRGQSAMQYLDAQVCQQGHPVIVGVELDASGAPGHFVVVTGKSGSDFQIADPGHNRTALSDYGNQFETRGFVADPPGDISALSIGISDAADFLISDPAGNRNGVDPATGQVIEEISNSAYFRDGLIDDLSGDSPTEVARTGIIGQPISGTYQLSVIGTKLGIYTLSVRGFSQDGSPQPAVTVSGMTQPGLRSTYLIEYSSTPGAAVRVFDTILQDESNGIIFNLNSTGGDYQFTRCSDGFTLNGRGQVIKRGCGIFLQDFSSSDRRVRAQIDNCQNIGNAAVQVFALGRTFTIVERNTTNNTGACQ